MVIGTYILIITLNVNGLNAPTKRHRLGEWIQKQDLGTSLVVQWLRLRAPNAGGLGSIPGQGTRSHMLQLKDSACCN